MLTDQQWGHVAVEMMAATGLAPHGDPSAVRWVAIRHADDHIHVVATLVRQDGKTAWAWNERLKAQATARVLEERYGLHRVGPADRTSHRRPSAGEQNKARREGRAEVPRDRLRREVRAAAAAAAGEDEFVRLLEAAGILVRLRISTTDPHDVTGYAVGLPAHRTTAGDTIWYGGGRLAPDLTLPRLRQRWRSAPSKPATGRPRPNARSRADTYRNAYTAVRAAADELRHASRDDDETSIADGASDVLIRTARAFEGRRGGPLTDAAETFDRAAREPHRRHVRQSRRAGDLRAMARLVAVMGRLTDDTETTAALQLVLHLSMLADNLADLREAQGRLHQARAARQAADQLRAVVPPRAAGTTRSDTSSEERLVTRSRRPRRP